MPQRPTSPTLCAHTVHMQGTAPSTLALKFFELRLPPDGHASLALGSSAGDCPSIRTLRLVWTTEAAQRRKKEGASSGSVDASKTEVRARCWSLSAMASERVVVLL